MIPVRLAVHNFMPYRDNVPPLLFEGIHTAAICGDNGNGKSALIDAMTWALWGKARAKSDDELIHQGQAEMTVEFDFKVGQQTYRVIRKHSKPKRSRSSGQTALDFQAAAGSGFKSIAGSTIRETQQGIIDVLRMDYPTFINSAYLRQGHADQFTISDPADRKKVLANILELSRYDELEEKAKEQAKLNEEEKARLETAISDTDEELAQKPACETELIEAGGRLASIEKSIKEQEFRLNEFRQKREYLENKKTQLAQLEQHLAETARALQHWNEQINQHQSQIKEYEELITKRASIEEGYTQFASAKKLNDEFNQKLKLLNALNERKHWLDITIERASQALLKEHALAQNKISELETSYEKLPQLKSELQQLQTQLNQLAGEEETIRKKRQANHELRDSLSRLESEKARLEKEIGEIGERLGLLLTHSETKCPLCETELGTDRLKLIEIKYNDEKQQKSGRLHSSQTEMAQKKTELGSLESEISQLETRLSKSRASAQGKVSLLTQEINRAEKAGQELNDARQKLAEIEEHLAKKEFAASEQDQLRQIEEELTRLSYSPEQHEETRRRLQEFEQYETPKRRLEEADRLYTQEKENLQRAEQASHELRYNLEVDNGKKETLNKELSLLPEVIGFLTQAETESQVTKTQQKQAQETIGTIKGRLEHFAQLEARRGEKETLLGQATTEEGIYKDLAKAFGKSGIQALLIETALPELESEANNLLARMTDNKMHIKIEPQRETKKGDVRETLDINITDELGTRSYEMFSGGECFRINFAIRVALSKLLAKRAGAPLPTLIIDEGFGTQDIGGLEKLKEAITSIQDDFEKILVITHIEEFRDAFPTRINVTKTTQGSMIEVS
ncbi:MAG: SMC family ATPase [Chloroflexota bacterium]